MYNKIENTNAYINDQKITHYYKKCLSMHYISYIIFELLSYKCTIEERLHACTIKSTFSVPC
jgi:hypothetical protein